DFNQVVDVTANTQAVYEVTSLNEKTNVLYADLKIKIADGGRYAIGTPLLVGVRNIQFSNPPTPLPSDPLPYLRDTDGRLPDGTPYYDFTSLVRAGMLMPAPAQLPYYDTTLAKSLAFYNPARKRFTYDLVVMAGINRPPRFTSVPRVEAVVG